MPSNTGIEGYDVLSLSALIEAHSGNWSSAYSDAKQSIHVRPSTMGYIAMALAQAGMGREEEALKTFDSVLGGRNSNGRNVLSVIKAAILFVASKFDEAIACMNHLLDASGGGEDVCCYLKVLGKMYLMRGDYHHALEPLKQARELASSRTGRVVQTISLIFAWDFDRLQITAQRYYCGTLLDMGRVEEVIPILLEILKAVRTNEVTPGWVKELQEKCTDMLEAPGDESLSYGRYSEAIARYSSALRLSPPNTKEILLKRSKAQAVKESWEDALADADEVIRLDPSSYRGYEMKYVALHGAKRHGEATDAVYVMFSLIEHCPEDELDSELLELRTNYRSVITDIDNAIGAISNLCPLVLIDLTTGQLCGAEERTRILKSESLFKILVSEAVTKQTETVHIRQTIAKYFQWVMFSHTWEGNVEPTFKDVNSVESVWKLDQSPLNKKLQKFCATARKNGYRWAWSDTCCIDKDTSAILSQSLTSMYSWYAEAAETFVYLADVLPESETGALTESRWMTRAWTLQELLASKVIRFYDNTWKPYLNDMSTNHKESDTIKRELARAMGVAPETITSFRPEDLGVREKLRLASMRSATVEEDVAYSLIGIFSSDIAPRYGLKKTAVGQLLENIVARSGDVTVIAWTGTPLPYNSALPSSLGVYAQIPYSPPPMETSDLDILVEQLKTQLSPQEALTVYRKVRRLPRATFSHRCLHLPCIVFSVTKVRVQEFDGDQGHRYCASVSHLGRIDFRTTGHMPLELPNKLVFVHPWLHELCGPTDRIISCTEQEDGLDSNWEDNITRQSPSLSELSLSDPSAQPVQHAQALRLIACLCRPFNALLLAQQSNGQYKRVAPEHEIIVPGVPNKANFNNLRADVLEIV